MPHASLPGYRHAAVSPEGRQFPKVFYRYRGTGGAETECDGQRMPAHIWRVKAA